MDPALTKVICKRKGSEHTSKACENCKYRHKKCDGQFPCQRCTKAGNECTYNANNLKRGPGAKIKKLQEKISLLEEEVKRANEFNKQLQDHIFIPQESTSIIVNRQIESTIYLPVQTAPTSTTFNEMNYEQAGTVAILSPLSPSFEVATCITYYLNRFEDFKPVTLPQVDLSNFINNEGNLRQNLLLSSALASIASFLGHPLNAQSFLQKAKTLMPMYFDSTHPDVAYSHSFMARSYGRLCGIQESELHNGVAMTMINSLMRKPEIASNDQLISSLSLTLAELLFSALETAFSRNAFKKSLEEFVQYNKSANAQNKGWNEYVILTLKLWFFLLDGNNDKLMLMGLIEEASMMIPKDAHRLSMFYRTLNIAKAALYFRFGNYPLAAKLSDQVLESIETDLGIFSQGAAIMLCAIGQIYHAAGCSAQYQRTLEHLTKLIPRFPMAEKCYRLLVSPDTVDSTDLIMTIPVFGRQFQSEDEVDLSADNTSSAPLPQESLGLDCSSSDLFSNLSSPQLMSLVNIDLLDDFI